MYRKIYKGNCTLANKNNWGKEYLGPSIAVKSVKDVYEAIDHVNKYGTMHTDAIITNDKKKSLEFRKRSNYRACKK